jgi:hypothetical protein
VKFLARTPHGTLNSIPPAYLSLTARAWKRVVALYFLVPQAHKPKTVCFILIAITLHNLSCFRVDEVVHLRGKSVNVFVGGVVHLLDMNSTIFLFDAQYTLSHFMLY